MSEAIKETDEGAKRKDADNEAPETTKKPRTMTNARKISEHYCERIRKRVQEIGAQLNEVTNDVLRSCTANQTSGEAVPGPNQPTPMQAFLHYYDKKILGRIKIIDKCLDDIEKRIPEDVKMKRFTSYDASDGYLPICNLTRAGSRRIRVDYAFDRNKPPCLEFLAGLDFRYSKSVRLVCDKEDVNEAIEELFGLTREVDSDPDDYV